MAGHVVTAPLVISKREDGSDLYLYEGSVLPDSVKADEVKRLTNLGLIEASDSSDAKKSAAKKPAAESN